MPESDLPLLIEAAQAAGDLAAPYWRRDPQVWEKSDNAGPVTEADLAVDEMLKSRLLAARPDYGWLSEETDDDSARLSAEKVFIIDPIDGTRSFIAGESTWAHSLAVAENGVITSAVVYLPMRQMIYSASLGGGARLNDREIRHSAKTHIEGATVLSNRASFAPSFWPRGLPLIERHFRPSLAYRLSLVAEGRFDAMVTLRDTWEWDVAAGSLIATEAGATVSDSQGGAVRFNNAHPALSGLIVAGLAVHQGLCDCLKP